VITRPEVEREVAGLIGSATEARWLVEEVLGRQAHPAAAVSNRARSAIVAMAVRRRAGEPLQYVLGTWAFRTLEIAVDARALIPRPETEQLVEVALVELRRRGAPGHGPRGAPVSGRRPGRRGPVVVDLGTGSGVIALAIAAELVTSEPCVEVWATDVDADALALAEDNRARVGAVRPAAAERVRLRQGSWFGALPATRRGRVDLVVANPPYVSEEEWANLDPEVRLEPVRALVAGPGSDGTPGLAGIEAVLDGAIAWLAPGGAVVVELAPPQADAAARVARGLGLADVRIEPDLAGRERVLVGHR
jgi:release factor glutamine methyltransferase